MVLCLRLQLRTSSNASHRVMPTTAMAPGSSIGAASQRAGRCGRVADGICIRLYDEREFADRPKFTEPEILRSSLAGVILRMKALRLGMHVMLFSDNVPLEEEIRLKKRASELRLLVMGPDCGTAIVNGVGLGFANKVRKGPIGLVAASGTGLQQVTARCIADFDQQVRLDIQYIENQSFWLDLRIILKTPLAVISSKGAY